MEIHLWLSSETEIGLEKKSEDIFDTVNDVVQKKIIPRIEKEYPNFKLEKYINKNHKYFNDTCNKYQCYSCILLTLLLNGFEYLPYDETVRYHETFGEYEFEDDKMTILEPIAEVEDVELETILKELEGEHKNLRVAAFYHGLEISLLEKGVRLIGDCYYIA